MVDQQRWYFHPITVFVFSILALATSLFLYIYWYVEVSAGLHEVVRQYNLDAHQFFEAQTWVVILVLSILVGIILVGLFIIFVFNQKTLRFYRLQNNFINNFTHELKTPVTSLKLYLETFAKYDLPREDRLKYLGYMIQDVERLSEHIGRILDLARIESRSYGEEFSTMDPLAVTERFLLAHAHLFRNCDIRIHKPSGQSFACSLNLPLFEMLLMNLLTNAVKYNSADRPEIDIRFELQGRKLNIRFEDNGIGIAKAELKKIFRKFYQVGRADDMTAKGSGLGLYLVRHIAKMHKGEISAESRGAGRGSVFTLTLPLQMPLLQRGV
ncbi:MAG: Alkaline phosphatase synthesis sensor protein PhoR [Syntrophaceae bacterium PtaU1.Bin231]|nr:MAG: Alkaline phosphatase synthesis sensor protein PhoR [Syntrophaceae bacterium PtaU1.Bin231]HOG16814.1 HAMP domain-containing sensor histidine kinase [Syntrophales bacterium]